MVGMTVGDGMAWTARPCWPAVRVGGARSRVGPPRMMVAGTGQVHPSGGPAVAR